MGSKIGFGITNAKEKFVAPANKLYSRKSCKTKKYVLIEVKLFNKDPKPKLLLILPDMTTRKSKKARSEKNKAGTNFF
jgi:hypothetical protein